MVENNPLKVRIVDIPKGPSNPNLLADIVGRSSEVEKVSTGGINFEIRLVEASHPHTTGEHQVVWVTKESDNGTQGVEWDEMIRYPELQQKFVEQMLTVTERMRAKHGAEVIAGFHIGYSSETPGHKRNPKNFQAKPSLMTQNFVHGYIVGPNLGSTIIRDEEVESQPVLAVKQLDLAGIAACKMYAKEIASVAAEGVEQTHLPNNPSRPALKCKDLMVAMEAAYNLQANVTSGWVDAIAGLNDGLGKLLDNDPTLAAILNLHGCLRAEIKQLNVPGMLVAMDAEGQIWLIPFSAGNAAIEMLKGYVINRIGYDAKFYSPKI